MEHQERLRAALADRYTIESEIGSGGMATVYLAQDLKHDRKVAVKVLKPELAAVVGTERFLTEIRTTANLAHPHILPLHDSGEADGFLFYVMPYVEGESLRQRLDRDGQLPVEEAVRVAGHVADALDYAHQQGVIHRDIKPGNILFQAGDPVVTDFGISLAISAAGEGRLTETGLSLGTPYYMSPEQAAGDQTPTAASDVYSLGCVLYEMLTGDPPHTGSSAQAILGKILLGEVTRPTKLRRTIPANVEGVLLKALERLPADRFGAPGDLSLALRDKGFTHGPGTAEKPGAGLWKPTAIGLALVVMLALGAFATGFLSLKPAPPLALWQEIVPPGEGVIPEWGRYAALAPDGMSLVYRDTVGLSSGWQLFLKERTSVDGRPLSGTQRARDVTWSPDGEWIAYVVGTDLFKRSVRSPDTEKLLEGMDDEIVALDWMSDGSILCEQEGHTLVRISAQGGVPPDTVFDFTGFGLRWVHGIPEREVALVVSSGEMILWVVDLQADTAWVGMEQVARAWYTPTGHVVFVQTDGEVLITPFDLNTLEFGAEPVSLFEGVSTGSNIADMVMGRGGTLLFVQGGTKGRDYEVVWVDRTGREEAFPGSIQGDLHFPALSPSGSQLAIEDVGGGAGEILVHQLDRGFSSSLTTGFRPSWGPDPESVTFSSNRLGNNDLWVQKADGSGEARRLADLERGLVDAEWSPDSSWLVFGTSSGGSTLGDILGWRLGQDTVPVELVATQELETGPALSPNGRFLAYTTYEVDEYQVYVRPFPDVDKEIHRISIERGIEPVWGRDGKELFYRKSEYGDLMAVDVDTSDSLQVGAEHVLFPAGKYRANGHHTEYDVAPDGQRFVMLRPVALPDSIQKPRIILIQDWFTDLRQRVRR
jgi:serine/threonine-protein kinase